MKDTTSCLDKHNFCIDICNIQIFLTSYKSVSLGPTFALIYVLFWKSLEICCAQTKTAIFICSTVSERSYHLDYQRKLQGHPDTPTLPSTTDLFIQCSVQGCTLYCSVVQWCWGDLEIFPTNLRDKIPHEQVKKYGRFFGYISSRFANFKKDINQSNFPS